MTENRTTDVFAFGWVQAFSLRAEKGGISRQRAGFVHFCCPVVFSAGCLLGKSRGGEGHGGGSGKKKKKTCSHTGITFSEHIEVSTVWSCLYVIKPLLLNRLGLMTLLVCVVVLTLCFFPQNTADGHRNKNHSHVQSCTLLCEAPWNWH